MSPQHPLLGLLVRGEKHGYELKRIVDDEFAPYWRIDFAQLYRSLAKMTRNGWVKARAERGAAGPERKVYALTARGRAEFDQWLAEPAQDHDEFFVKARLAADCGGSIAYLVEPQRRTLENEHATRARRQRAAQDAGDAGQLLVAHAALRETEAALSALDLYAAVASPTRARREKTLAAPIIIGSDDPLLAQLALLAHTSAQAVGSIGGLLALAQHQANVAGIHLLDSETGEYNVPFVKHLVPEEDIVLVNLAFRENGLLIARGNPKNIRGVRAVARRDVRFINRQRGAGTRLLVYSKLRQIGINPHAVPDWDRVANTHDAVAGAIATGAADVGPGLRAVAAKWDLDFIPLGEERYDLAISRADFESPQLRALIEALHGATFRQQAAAFQGYDLARSGQVVAQIR
jgi:molybdate-binding protein/DNA-binding PadR family transcriptional regulator